MRKHRVFAVDDEQLALRRLEIVLAKMPDVELVGTANSVTSAVARIGQLRPDFLLLDIAMPGETGFDLIERLPADEIPHIIFVTAFDRYAAEAFERNAVDYVLKPVQPERLQIALKRAGKMLDLVERAERLKKLMASLTTDKAAPGYADEFWANRHQGRVRVRVSDIKWAQAERDYVRLHTSGDSFLVRETMDKLEQQLDPQSFVRVHRSAIVRLDEVESVTRRVTGLLVARLVSGDEINIGRRYAKSFSEVRSKLVRGKTRDLH